MILSSHYASSVLGVFKKLNVDPIAFDPKSPSILRNPEYVTLDDQAREAIAVELFEKRLLSAIKRSSPVTTQVALARAFLAQKWISEDSFNTILPTIRPSFVRKNKDVDTVITEAPPLTINPAPISAQAAGVTAGPKQ